MGLFTIVLSYVGRIVPILPLLIQAIESLWKGVPKSGPQKWIGVEQAIGGSITAVAQEVAALAPAGTSASKISAALAVFTKAVNDAIVRLFNDLGIFSST